MRVTKLLELVIDNIFHLGVEMSGWCCLHPPKIPGSYHASLVCLHSLSQINLLGVLSAIIQHHKIIRPLLRLCVYILCFY